MAMRELLRKLENGEHLGKTDVREAVEQLLSDTVPAGDKEEFLSKLHRRGETPAEIAAFVDALLVHAVVPVLGPRSADAPPLLDVCGTGGDKAGLFNVSTAVMFVVAACGVHLVKHGNRGLTSKCGGADVLQALGVPVDIPASLAGEFLNEHGFVFLFAPQYHPAFKAIVPIRQALAARGETTIFNILGPLLNPARPDFQLSGVFNPSLLETYAEVFRLLGRRRAWAVHGTLASGGGLDEISPNGTTTVCALDGDAINHWQISASDFVSCTADSAQLAGGGPEENARILKEILSGQDHTLRREIVLINAGAAMTVCGRAAGLHEGIALAKEAVDSGIALEVLRHSVKTF
jgi:anthranilate phosphoribosyltransferase